MSTEPNVGMKKPDIPLGEAGRVAALCSMAILDTPAEERFDRITRIAQAHFRVPIALVSLVDSERQWFKSRQGLDASETPRDISFCGHAILSDDTLYIPNALDDLRFADNPLVTGGPKIRFYAGAPLHSPEGERVGTLCVIDDKPRVFSDAELMLLRDMAGCAEEELARTNRLEATQQIRDQEQRIRALVDTIVDGIIVIDARGIVQTLNPAAVTLFGYPADEVQGQNIKMLMPEPYAHGHDGYLSNYLTTGDKKVIGIGREVTGKRKNGSTFPMELAVSEMEVNGERMFTGIVRDITERKKVEQMKSEFISTVSHELRTPLTSIRGALGLVLGNAAGELPEKARLMLEMAARNSERLTLLINDILDLEKIEAGHLEFDFGIVDLVALAARALEDNQGYAHKHQVRLLLDCHIPEAPVRADEHRLLQVFSNLISNAVKYSPASGVVEVSVAADGANFRVAVRDHGAGIPQAFRSRIFQRFAQADSSDTREKGGTGLGLSITKAIVERHEGTVGYDTEAGVGTLFYFDLPAWQALMENDKTHLGIRVLLCEDNPDVAQVLADMLKPEGVVCDIAGSAAGARTLLEKHLYRLMLLDLTLPDVDGLKFLQELRDEPDTAQLPIIVVSGRAHEGRAAFRGEAITVVDWIQKPVSQQRLKQALQEALLRVKRPRILHVEDDLDIVQVTRALLGQMADIISVSSLRDARQVMANQHFDLVILDLGLTDGSGVELLAELQGYCPVVIFSAHIPNSKISAQVAAALTKSVTSNEQLLVTIKNILKMNEGSE